MAHISGRAVDGRPACKDCTKKKRKCDGTHNNCSYKEGTEVNNNNGSKGRGKKRKAQSGEQSSKKQKKNHPNNGVGAAESTFSSDCPHCNKNFTSQNGLNYHLSK